LLHVDASGALVLDEETVALLRRRRGGVCSVAIAGPKREGKSTLANALMEALGGGGGGGGGGGFPVAHAAADAQSKSSAEQAPQLWAWLSPATSQTLPRGCASVLLLDSTGLTGGVEVRVAASAQLRRDAIADGEGADAALRRSLAATSRGARHALAFALLVSSRVVLNVRRQPREEIWPPLARACELATQLRVSSHAQPLTPPPTSPDYLLLPPPPSSLERSEPVHLVEAVAASAAEASSAPAGKPELLLLLRDVPRGVEKSGQLSSAQVLERYAAKDPRDPRAAASARDVAALTEGLLLRAAERVRAPSDLELEALSHRHGLSLATSFGVALSRVAASLLQSIRGLRLPISAGDGEVVADGPTTALWMQLVVDTLNAQP